MKAFTIFSTGALVLALLTACSISQDCADGADCAPPDGQPVASTASPNTPETEAAEMNDERVQAAVADLGSRWDVSQEEIQIAYHRSVTWSDGSAGCPKPGEVYTQALMPGELLILSVDGEQANYHSANGGNFAYCDSPTPPSKIEPVNPDI